MNRTTRIWAGAALLMLAVDLLTKVAAAHLIDGYMPLTPFLGLTVMPHHETTLGVATGDPRIFVFGALAWFVGIPLCLCWLAKDGVAVSAGATAAGVASGVAPGTCSRWPHVGRSPTFWR